jgi:TonB-dependent starch-binding outer membrane protein SusC
MAPLLLLIGCLTLSLRLFSQRITLSEKGSPLEKVFRHIEQQSGYVFFYDYAWLEKTRPVTLELKDVPLSRALEGTFKNQPLKYSVIGKNIVVQPKTDSASKEGPYTEPPDEMVQKKQRLKQEYVQRVE